MKLGIFDLEGAMQGLCTRCFDPRICACYTTDPIRTLRRVRDHRVLEGDVPRSVQTRSVLKKQGRRAERKAREIYILSIGGEIIGVARKKIRLAHLDRMNC